MEQKMTYVIRRIAYEYNDQFMEIQNGGDIDTTFDNYEEAHSAWRAKEIAAFRNALLTHFAPIASWDETGEIYRQQLFAYMNFDAEKNRKKGLKIPKIASDEQVWEIRRLSGIRFYTLTEFSGNPEFYVIRTFKPFFDEDELVNWNDTPILYNTYEEAMHDVTNQLMYFNLKGTPEELSDMPDIFRQLIDSHPMFVRDETPDMIDVVLYHYHTPEDNTLLYQFIEILKVKPFIIEKVSMDTIRKVTA